MFKFYYHYFLNRVGHITNMVYISIFLKKRTIIWKNKEANELNLFGEFKKKEFDEIEILDP